MKPPFRLVPDDVSHDTIEATRYLANAAQRGEVIGIAFAVALKGRKFWVNSAGECYRNPTFARGMVAALDDELSDRVWGN